MAELGHVGVNFSNPFHHNLKIKSKTTSSFCFFFFFFFAHWISLPSSLHQSHLWFAPPPPPNSQTATNRGLFLERVRCVCIHMMDEGDVSHLSRKGGERWGRDRWRWREQRLKGWGGGSRSRGLRGHDVTIQEVWGWMVSGRERDRELPPEIFPGAAKTCRRAAEDQQAALPPCDSARLQTDEGWQRQPDILYHPIRIQFAPVLALGENWNLINSHLLLFPSVSPERKSGQRWEACNPLWIMLEVDIRSRRW